jgi:hypothetical protein
MREIISLADGSTRLVADDGRELIFPKMGIDAFTLAARDFFGPDNPLEARQIRKSTVIRRLEKAGKMEAAMAALLANATLFGLWTAADAPMVRVNDENAVAFLKAIGADVATILAPE